MIVVTAVLCFAAFVLATIPAWRNAYGSSSVKVYVDLNDWWVGVYRGPDHYYLCLIPTLVIRWRRHGRKPEPRH